MVDFLIVGGGIAGFSFAETALNNGSTVAVVTDASQNSSLVAGGIYNPLILKRLSLPQDAADNIFYIKGFYKTIEQRLDTTFDHSIPVCRKFHSLAEQNAWFEAADKPALQPFLSTEIVRSPSASLPAPFGLGKVNHTGYLDTQAFVASYSAYLSKMGCLIKDTFKYDDLNVNDDFVEYKGLKARNVVFAEGFGISANPFFNYLPLNGTKGELLVIEAPDLKLELIINSSVFILPMGNDLYKVGATYEWTDKTNTPTAAARTELTLKLKDLITCDFKVEGHLAGIRPTVKDRKALIGTHPQYKNVHLLNGLGTRGVILGPAMAKELYESVTNGTPVRDSVNFMRFYPA